MVQFKNKGTQRYKYLKCSATSILFEGNLFQMQTYSSVKIQFTFLHYRLPLLPDNGRKQNDFVYHLKIKNMKNFRLQSLAKAGKQI
jgi:hypothetical protein